MKRESILLYAAWLGTTVLAYLVGSTIGESTGKSAAAHVDTAKAPGAGITGGPADGSGHGPREQRSFLRPADELDDSGHPVAGRHSNVQLIVARARQELGNNLGGAMDFRRMLRAVAPLMELEGEQCHEALVEVEKTVTDPQAKTTFYSVLLGQWAETDAKGALAYTEERIKDGAPFITQNVAASVVGVWARRDPDSAWRWYQTERQDDGNKQNSDRLLVKMFTGLAAHDLDSALQRVGTLDDATRGVALAAIAQSVTDDAARRRLIERIDGIPEGQRIQIRMTIGTQWTMQDPDAAAKWIHSLPALDQRTVRNAAGNALIYSRPERASELLLQGAEDKEKPQIYDRVVQQWSRQNPKAAGEWLAKQPPSPELDQARRTYSVAILHQDPAAAMDWARSIQGEELRLQGVNVIYQHWKARDANAANAGLETAGLPADHVERIKKGLPSGTATTTERVPATRNP